MEQDSPKRIINSGETRRFIHRNSTYTKILRKNEYKNLSISRALLK